MERCIFKDKNCDHEKGDRYCRYCKDVPDGIDYSLRMALHQLRMREYNYISIYQKKKFPDWLKEEVKKQEKAHGMKGCYSFKPQIDHTGLLESKKDGSIRYITEPYELDMESTKELIKECEEMGLEFIIHGKSIHNPGSTICIEITKKNKNDNEV